MQTFSPFDLTRLLRTVFDPKPLERIGILIDLPNPTDVKEFGFLKDPQLSIQKYAAEVFYEGLKKGVLEELKLAGGELYAYQITGGSNLDLPDEAYDFEGKEYSLEKEIYPNYDILLCISTYSATAPLTAFAKRYGFRGATLHGVNQIILDTGLSVDYEEVSRQTEKLRLGMTRADKVEVDFKVNENFFSLEIYLNQQEAQKSHGLCRGNAPDVANLPAGEIYYVPSGAKGYFPMKYEDGTLGLMTVREGRVVEVKLLQGEMATIEAHRDKLKSDPVTGEIGELGFGTQELPFSGRDIQDEKILGTFHLATGRSDHLGGHLTPDKFANAKNATHDDILFAPHKTPEIKVPQVRLYRNGSVEILTENYQPSAYLKSLLASN